MHRTLHVRKIEYVLNGPLKWLQKRFLRDDWAPNPVHFTGFYRVLPGFSEFRESSRRLRPRGSGCGFRVQLCAFLEPHCTSLNASFGRRGWAGPSERNSELPRPLQQLFHSGLLAVRSRTIAETLAPAPSDGDGSARARVCGSATNPLCKSASSHPGNEFFGSQMSMRRRRLID